MSPEVLLDAIRVAVREEVRAALESRSSDVEGLLTFREAAARAHVSVDTIEEWVEAGLVPRLGVGRVRRVQWPDVLRAMQRAETQALQRVAPEDIAARVLSTLPSRRK